MKIKASSWVRPILGVARRMPGVIQNACQRFGKAVFLRLLSLYTPKFSIQVKHELHKLLFSEQLLSRQHKKWLHTVVITLVLVSFSVYSLYNPSQNVLGASYTWTQSSWAGGVSSSVGTHPGDQTGWNKYSTSTLAAVGSNVTIASTTYTFTDDGAVTSNGPGSGGGWLNSATSSVTVSGSGSSAIATLSIASQSSIYRYATSSVAAMPADTNSGHQQIISASGSDYIYYIAANNVRSSLHRYSVSNNSWTTLDTTIDAPYFGAELLWNGSDDYIYLIDGNASTNFERYQISNNTWSSLASLPAALASFETGFALRNNSEDYIYVPRGPSFSNFYRYSIVGNSWSSMATSPAALASGTYGIRNGSEDYIYVVRGSGTNNFYRYSITGNSWSSMATLPGNAGSQTVMVRDDGSDYIYVLTGGNFYRYSITNNSWTTLATSGANQGRGDTLLHYPGEDTIYAYTGNDCCSNAQMWAYSILSNTWTKYDDASVGLQYGRPNATAVRIGNNQAIFTIPTIGGSTAFQKFLLNQVIYQSSGTLTSATLDLGAAKMKNMSWTSSTPSGVGSNAVKFQLAANNDNSTWNYVGPDGTASTYFTTSTGVTSFPSSLSNMRYWRYKAYLSTSDTSKTPTLYDVTFSFNSYASTQSVTATDDTSLTTTGSASGGGFGNGASASTTVTGSGVAASVVLAVTTTPVNQFQVITSTPASFGAGTQMVRATSSDYIYVVPGGSGGAPLYRYSISGNSWTSLAAYNNAFFGDSLLWNGTDDFMYFINGSNNQRLERYTISGNSWSTLANVPGAIPTFSFSVGLQTGNEDYLYYFPGSTTSFWRYSIAGNSWTALTPVPTTTGSDLYAIRDGSSDYIYLVPGNGTKKFYRYSIAGNSWTPMADTPSAGGSPVQNDYSQGANLLLRDSGSDTIYLQTIYHTFHAYSVSGNTWSTLTAGPTGVAFDLLHNPGDDLLYAYAGKTGTSSMYMWAYSISGDNWTQYNSATNQLTNGVPGMTAIRSGNEPYIYTLSSPFSSQFTRFTISSTTYASSGTFTSASIDLGSLSTLTRIAWTSTTPSGVGSNAIRFQIAMNNDNSTWSYVGPDGTASTYFSTNGGTTFSGAHSGFRYLRYKAYLATADTTVTPSLDSITFTYNAYTASGNLTSNIYDGNDPTNVVASIAWSQTVPGGTSVQFQVRAAAASSSIAAAVWQGPDGTSNTYFTTAAGENTSTTLRTGSGSRYFQYKAFLSSSNFSITPTLSSVTVTYVVNAAPEVRNVSAVSNSDGTVSISYEARDIDTNTGTNSPGFVTPSFQYCPNGSNCQTITSLLSADTANKAVQTSNWNSYTATWRPRVDFPSVYDTHATVRITVNDNEAANNTAASTTAQFLLDTIPPSNASFTIDASQSPAVLTFTGTDTSTVRYRYAVTTSSLLTASYVNFNVSSPSSATTTISTTTNPFSLYATVADAYGNSSTLLTATTPEQPSAMMVQDTSNVNLVPTELRLFIAWKATTGAFASYKVYRSTDQSVWTLIGTINDSATNYFGDSTVSQNTIYYYRVNTVDSNGNVSYNSATISAKADGIQNYGEGGGGAPSPAVISNVSSTPGSTSAVITWDTDILADSAVGYSTSSGQFTATTSVGSMVNNSSGVGQHSVTLTNLAPNTTYYFDVQSKSSSNLYTTDANGGGGYTFTTLNGTVISHVAVSQVFNNSATVVWDTDAPADSYVVYSTSPSMSAPSTVGGSSLVSNHSVALTNLTAGTTYYYYIQSTNGGGVLSEDKHVVNGLPTYYSFGTTNDVTGPTISNVSSTPSVTYATISWQTNEVADSMVEYGTSTGYGSTTTLDTTLTIQHQVTVSGLTADTVYDYRIHTKDSNGNETISSNLTFRTAAAADTTAPAISGVTTSTVSLTDAIIRWTTDENANATVDYGTSPSYGSLAGTPSDYSSSTHAVTLSGLSGNTTYYFRVRSQDAAGNTAVNDNGGQSYTFVTVADTTPPTITNVTTTLVSNSSAVITWTTNEDANSQVDYSTTTNFGAGLNVSTSTMVQTHVLTITGLAPGTTYHFRVHSTDLSGNATLDDNTGLTYTFTTTGQPDTTPPTISGVVTSSVSLSSAVIRWTTNENANALVEYGTNPSYGSVAGSPADFSTSTHTVTLTGLQANIEYYFRVRSQDVSGNTSVSDNGGNGYSFLTVPDTTPPVITNVFTALYNDTSAVITWRTDEDANSQVDFSTSTTFGGSSEATSTLDKNHAMSLTGLSPSTQYYYRVRSTDLSGNTRTEDNGGSLYSFITASTGVTIIQQPVSNAAGGSYALAGSSIDTTPPSITGIQVADITRNTATVKWTTDEPATSFVRFGETTAYDSLTGDYTNYPTEHSVILSNLLTGTFYHFKVASQDKSGNASESADQFFATLKDDNTVVPAPTSTPTPLTPEEAQQKKFIDSVTQASKDTIQKILEALLKNPSLPDLSEDTFVKAVTEMANRIVLAPTIVGPKPQVTVNGTTAVVRWSTDKNSSSQVLFAKDGDYAPNGAHPYTNAAVAPGELTTTHEVTIPDLAPGTIYHFQVVSKGVIGPESRSDDSIFATKSNPPVITNIQVTTPSESSATISWQTNVPTAATIEYVPATGTVKLTQGDTSLLVNHSITIKNLQPGTAYTAMIKCVDETSNEVDSAPFGFNTTLDAYPPVITKVGADSTLYPGRTSKVQTVISWLTNEPATAQVFYHEGTGVSDKISSTTLDLVPATKHVAVITSFKPGAVYTYWVESSDTRGNATTSEKFTILTPQERETIIDIMIKNFDQVFGWTKQIGI